MPLTRGGLAWGPAAAREKIPRKVIVLTLRG